LRSNNQTPRILGFIVEVPPRKRIFIPITRVTSIDNGHVIITGLLNMRRFEPRTNEISVLSEMLDRSVTLIETNEKVTIEDIGMELSKTGDWFIEKVHVMRRGVGLRRRGASSTVTWNEISGFTISETNQGVSNLLGTLSNLRAADLASVLHDLTVKRRAEVARALDDERLADVLEEMNEASRVELLAELEGERAADVLEEMDPDDAADLLREIGQEKAQTLLALMEPEDAEDVQRLMRYEDYSAGGMMTTEPIVLTADSTVAEALSRVRLSEVAPGLASQVFVCRQPLETPTGRLMGVVHIQRLLREPPATLLGSILDSDIAPLAAETPLSEVSSYLASYNLLAVPIVDANERLLGVVTVDDVLDHLLPENWRQDETKRKESESR
jgi:CBS domain-containing protein